MSLSQLNSPLFIDPRGIASFAKKLTFGGHLGLLNKPGEAYKNNTGFILRGNVAIVPVRDTLTHRNDAFAQYFGLSNYEALALTLADLLADTKVTAIIFDIDSLGGQVFGLEELADKIYEARATKPIHAFASGYCCSAAYWLAAACEQVHAQKGAWLGSVGTRMTLMDDSGFWEQHGIKFKTFVSQASPDKAADPFDDDHGAKLYQGLVDQGGANFVASLAKYRGVSEKHVLANFGQGWIMEGPAGITAKLCDQVCSLEDLITQLDPASSADDNDKNNKDTMDPKDQKGVTPAPKPDANTTVETPAAEGQKTELTAEQRLLALEAKQKAQATELAALAAEKEALKAENKTLKNTETTPTPGKTNGLEGEAAGAFY